MNTEQVEKALLCRIAAALDRPKYVHRSAFERSSANAQKKKIMEIKDGKENVSLSGVKGQHRQKSD